MVSQYLKQKLFEKKKIHPLNWNKKTKQYLQQIF